MATLDVIAGPNGSGNGIYRIDALWNDPAVWRTFFNIVE